jgi:hypothetical protein
MRRTIVRRLCKLLPPCEFDYNVVNKQSGLSSKGLQWAQEHCEAFFLRVLGDPRQPGSAPWPAVSEMKPKQELKYLARELSMHYISVLLGYGMRCSHHISCPWF